MSPVVAFLTLIVFLGSIRLATADGGSLTVEVFTRRGCPHCVEAHRFLTQEYGKRSDLRLEFYDVTEDEAALLRLRKLSAKSGVVTPGVPAIAIGDTVLVGFDPSSTPNQIRRMVEQALEGDGRSDACELGSPDCDVVREERRNVTLPLVGEVSVERLGLPTFTILLGLVDGFNPCATWVLLFLLSMLVNLKSRSRMALVAGTFVVVSGIVYFAFMAAWLTFFTVVGVSTSVRVVLSAFALLFGGLNIKDFFALGKGPSLVIPESAKPGFYARVRRVLRAETLWGSLGGIVVIAFLVNLLELLCTAGLPALYTAILTSLGLSTWQYYGYLALYIGAYMVDDAILVTIGVVTLSKWKLQERGGRWLKLVSGLTILSLGIVLLVRPHWLAL